MMNFWDSSALVPLIVKESCSEEMFALYERSDDIIVWFLTSLEILSALTRRKRAGQLDGFDEARSRLSEMRAGFNVVQDFRAVALRAERLIAVHPLKAADALQLAASLISCRDHTEGHRFITLDGRLAECARKEGFAVSPRPP